jgi:mono/diheme cytochrome c family protein
MNGREVFSILGVYDSAAALMEAIPKVRAGVTAKLEAYTPYPVHGLDEALNLRKSPITGMVLVMAIIGVLAALGLQLWTSGVDYPQMTAGKPYFSWEAFIPILFELMVLFAAFTAGLGMLLLLNRLPFFRHPMLGAKSMPLITRDKFALAVESGGNTLDVEKIAALLRESGATAIEVVEAPPARGPSSPRFFTGILLAIAISCVVAGYATYWAMKLFPTAVPMVHMLNQPRLDAQKGSEFFKDGSGMRMPVEGTVSRISVPYTVGEENDAAALGNPLPRTAVVLNRGRRLFNDYCSVCHGILGDGRTALTAAYEAKPANLLSKNIVVLADGSMYHVLMKGKNSMPSYAADLAQEERWAVLHYVRVLQRALDAKDEDVASAGQ